MKRRARFITAIVGAGKVGSVLGKLLIERGQRVACIVSRSERSARAAGRFLGCRRFSTSLQDIPPGVNLILIATPHEEIAGVAGKLATLDHFSYRRLAACHTSGMMTAGVLEPLSRRGAVVFSFHPLQTFPRDFAPGKIVGSIRGIFYGVDGPARGIVLARRLAGVLEGKTLTVPPEMREFYHAACVVASNHLTTLLWVLERMYHAMGGKKKAFSAIFKPIVEATLRNIELTSPARSLSGPVARGGVQTVSGHLASIEKHLPDILSYFLMMTEETVRLAKVKGSISDEQAVALNNLIRSYRREPSRLEVIL